MTIQLIPAIDLKEGNCVRLKQGDMSQSKVFSDDPVTVAKHWLGQGSSRLHIVDLDGAFAGVPQNKQIIERICKLDKNAIIQIGGGIRSLDTIEEYLSFGASFCIIGTQAVREPEFVEQACKYFPKKIIVGIDAKDNVVAVSGWGEATSINAVELAKTFTKFGVSTIVYTDITKDGMLSGLNLEATNKLASEINIPVIASGGLASMDDIKALARLKHIGNCGIIGAITGMAIYNGNIDFKIAQNFLNTF